jgi:hypothetical protein
MTEEHKGMAPDIDEKALDWMRRDTLRSCLGPNAVTATRALEEGGGALGRSGVSIPQALRAMQLYHERMTAYRIGLSEADCPSDSLHKELIG